MRPSRPKRIRSTSYDPGGRSAGIAAIVLAGVAVLAATAAASGVTQSQALFLQGRPHAGERFTAAITCWTGQSVAVSLSGGFCQASIRTRQGGLQRRLGSGTAHPLPDDGSLPGADAWSWKVPRSAAGNVLVVVCARLVARIDSGAAVPVRLVKLIRPGFVHRWRIAAR